MSKIPRGLTVLEVLVTVVVAFVLLGIILPILTGARLQSGVDVSMQNLMTLHKASVSYGAEWNDRQMTSAVDNLSTYGTNGPSAITNYAAQTGMAYPPVILGNCDLAVWGYYFPPVGNTGNYVVAIPFDFPAAFGSFRLPNIKPMQAYVDGHFYSPKFYAPNDRAAYSTAEPLVRLLPVAGGAFQSNSASATFARRLPQRFFTA
jgi:hypothetical protein